MIPSDEEQEREKRLLEYRKIVARDGKEHKCPKGHTMFARLDGVSQDGSWYRFFCSGCGAKWSEPS